jgi:hypothetical protein
VKLVVQYRHRTWLNWVAINWEIVRVITRIIPHMNMPIANFFEACQELIAQSVDLAPDRA